ncbi:hypothetical protein CDV55_103824 [Aspergillus turcosus]|uniref:Protein kinase domain-containing protein n=1 Tax=Aspergillus turcosus TaxID=1245748 RepID=A0A229YI35_9EURO|nr:hypothetical protein CDV55_103824 [Aspergillus turcosus]RLL96276.1 hypothetical protein CFD26_105320 [Aspergillus turcosus]
MLNFTHPIRWRIWPTIFSLISSFVRGLSQFLPYLDQPSRSLVDEDVERRGDCKGTDRNTATEENENVIFAEPSEPVAYEPPFEVLSQGSTALVSRVRPGVVVKSPRFSWWHSSTGATHKLVKDIQKSFSVEEQIYEILGEHPRIVRFLGVSQDPRGLLFAEASGGDLQAYIDQHVGTTDPALRVKWCREAAEAIHYIHQKGVIHSDLRPESYLLHNESLDLLLCDFGGSTSGNIDGGHLPDSGFFNPRNPWVSTKATDIFSLGSIFYTIMTDHWPYRSPGPFTSVEDKLAYGDMVDELFSLNKFPSTDGLLGGSVIQGCWMERYDEVEEILHDQDSSFKDCSAATNIT